MTSRDIVRHRLINQGIVNSDFTSSQEVVRWMGCIQAQDFAGAKWAIGKRIKGSTEAEIEKDFNDGKILRTHILRTTWHFVSPEDIRWMLKLTAPRVKGFCKSLHRKLGIDDKALKRSKTIISKALQDGQQLTREALQLVLKKGKLNTNDIRLGFYLMDAELDGIICSGPRKGKQFTYALLEARVPGVKDIAHDHALLEIGKRYFISRGPATLHDFAWWSGLTLTEAKKALEMNKGMLEHVVINGQAYWFAADSDAKGKAAKQSIHLLPAFDEFAVAYKDRTDILSPELMKQSGNGIFKPTIIVDGKIVGLWKRTEKKDKVHIDINPFAPMPKTFDKQVALAMKGYGEFVGKAVEKSESLEVRKSGRQISD